jgi:hypothetical protein
MTRSTLPCGCIIRHYDSAEDSLVEMDVEWCEVHERAEDLAKQNENQARSIEGYQVEVDGMRRQLKAVREAALKLPRPWMDGSIEFDKWIAAVDKVLEGIS